MSEEKVEIDTMVPEEIRDYIENRNVKLEDIIHEWITHDKLRVSSKYDEIYEKQQVINEIHNFISSISKIQDECYNEINKLRIEIKEIESKKENLI